MKRLSFLQIGDVHFPEAKSDILIDAKDDAVPSGLSGRFVPNKLQNVVREARRIFDNGLGKDGILLCGDLTTRGDKAGYHECLAYLAEALRIGDPSRWPDDHLHAVLGNHDVDRAAAPGGRGPFAKFDAFRSAWESLRPAILAVETVRDVSIEVDGCHAKIFSLNSCIGCGERRLLPQRVKDQLYDLLAPFISTAALERTTLNS